MKSLLPFKLVITMKSIDKEETPQPTKNKDELAGVRSQLLFKTLCVNELEGV